MLLSHPASLLSLPYITREKGFQGIVLATYPVLKAGEVMVQDLLHMMDGSVMGGGYGGLVYPLRGTAAASEIDVEGYTHLYTNDEAKAALTAVTPVGYGSWTSLADNFMQIRPRPSGLCIGGASWEIKVGDDVTVGLISSTSIAANRFPWNADLDSFRNSDVLLFASALNHAPTSPVSSSMNLDAMLGTMCLKVSSTIKRGGSVIIPCDVSSSILLDILPTLASYTKSQSRDGDVVPIIIISPLAPASLMACSISNEWLSPAFLHRIPSEDDPFTIGDLIKSGRLILYPDLAASGLLTSNSNGSATKRCIVITGHPSCRMGDAAKLMRMWNHQKVEGYFNMFCFFSFVGRMGTTV